MKKLTILIATLLLCAASLFAQSPEKFTYQAVVRNASNALVSNAPVGVRVSILQGSATGNAVYVETQTATTNANGLLTLEIGGGNTQQGNFDDIDWASGPYFLKTETDPNGGSNYSITSTQQLLSVPYALYAKEAGNVPTIPANVSAFTNDAGYITEQDIPVIPTVPTNVSSFINDAGYITMDSIPTIPTVPTNVSAFTNDVPYITAQDIPEIPTIPTNISAFTNDAGYITMDSIPTIPTVPTNVSAFVNDVPYLTSFTEQQVLSISNDTIFLTGGSFVKLPEGFNGDYNSLTNKPALFSGDYNDLTNTPTIPTVPTNVSAFTNDVGYITNYTEQQILSISNDTVFLTGGSFVKLPEGFDGDYNSLTNKPVLFSGDYNDLTNTPTIPVVPNNVSAFNNDVPYLTEAEFQQTMNQLQLYFDTVTLSVGGLLNTIDSLRSRLDELEGDHLPPTVMTTGVSDLSYRTVSLGGSVTMSGSAPVAARGFCYDTVMHPTIESNVVNCGSGSGSFNTNLLNLTANTTYYLRSYATNIWGTNYGNELTFTSLEEFKPTVDILADFDFNIFYTSFSCGGVVTDSGSYVVTARGICYDTMPEPDITSNHVYLGNGTGEFSTTLTNLIPGTTYYVRAYAMNLAGVSYSTDLPLTTLAASAPTVTTDSVSMYNECMGTVTSDGHSPVTQRGFCYDTLPNPTIDGNVILVGEGTGEFMATISGLSIGKLYFVRAFATNSEGTSYGEQIHFLAGCDTKTLTDYDGNVYNTVTVGTQCWIKENLRVQHYSDGMPIEYGGSNSSYDVAYYYYPGSNVNNAEMFGLLYNWKAMMRGDTSTNTIPSGSQGICPPGWHVPSSAEWNQLFGFVGNHPEDYPCGGKALADSLGWATAPSIQNPGPCAIGNNLSTNNATGFSLRAAGGFGVSGGVRDAAYYWTSTEKSNNTSCAIIYYARNLDGGFSTPSNNGYLAKSLGYSVRCLRD